MSSPFHLRVLDSLGDVDACAWDALLDVAAQPFLRHAFLHALEASGCVGGSTSWRPRHLTLWRGETLVAAAPAYARFDSRGEFVWDFAWAEASEGAGAPYYPKLVLAVPFTPATGTRMLVRSGEDRAACEAALVAGARELLLAEGYSGLHVLFCTEQEAVSLEQAGFSRRIGIQFHWRNPGYEDYDAFLARFSSKQRRNLRKERDGLQGITIETLRGDALASADAALLHRLYVATVDKHVFGTRFLNEDFFARLLATMPDALEVVLAEREGRVLGGALNLCGGNVLYGRYWGCFEEVPYLHFNVCYYHSIEACIERGVVRFEGGAGGEHKLARGFEPALTYSAHLLAYPPLAAAVRSFLEREREVLTARVAGYRSSTGLRPLANGSS